jgi:ribosome maturation factor RimP
LIQVHEKERELQREVADTVQSRLPAVDVLAVELSGPEHVTVYIDHPEGVDHALCASVTETLGDYLDRYRLDVSSPGLERPLRTQAHFAAAVGRRVALRTGVEIDGRKRFRGEVVEAGEREATIAVGNDRFDVPYEAIVRGNLIEERR